MTGDPITGIEEAEDVEGVHVLHAGTKAGPDGVPVSAGGRVLSVVAQGPTLAEARDNAYDGVSQIFLRGSHYRTDIAAKAIEGSIVVSSQGAGQ